jgi:ribonuclease D
MADPIIGTTEALIGHLGVDGSVGSQPRICAIDTEADSLHRYRESLCLIQFTDGKDCVLIDPLTIEDLSPLGTYLENSILWMHGADYDMTMLKRQFGTLPPVVYDTQIGARLLGARRFGLADLVLRYFDIELSKSSQKADWGKRPLSPKMVEYALNDVRYLLPMGEQIVEKLKDLDRHEWFEESCEAARLKVLERDDSKEEIWRIQGSGKLDRYGLACLRALWNWRDQEAATWDRPSFMVAPNRVLIEWATALSEKQKISLPQHYRSDRLKRFRDALAEVDAMPQSEWPERLKSLRRKRDRDFDRKLEILLKSRDKISAELDIEGSLIAARAALETIASGEAEPAELLLKWQRSCLGMH